MSNISVPLREALVQANGFAATKRFQDWMIAITAAIPSFAPLYLPDFGAIGNGIANDTAAFQKAVDTAVKNGGGTIIIPAGTFMLDTVTFPAGTAPITVTGSGVTTILKRRSTLSAGKGMLDVSGSNVIFDSFLIDGDVTTPVGLMYNADFSTSEGANDPMAPSLTTNSSIWIHGPCSNFSARRLVIQHSGGYAVLIDAGTGQITDVEFIYCRLVNNRPNLFGVGSYAAIYGSWTGGIYANGDGRGGNPGKVVKRFRVSFCNFLRNTGNQVWSHLYGLDELHEAFEFIGNYFEDIGLDGILVGGVTGGIVAQNDFRRIGYTTISDTDRGTPRWLPNLQATALDSSGLVKGVNYQGNTFLSVNGGCMDLDGHGDSSLVGNQARVPFAGEPEYTEDQIDISGYLNSGSTSYGINLGNTNNTPWGGKNVSIVGNALINLPGGSIRLYSARSCLVEANNIVVPDAPVSPPIAYGPGGSGANQKPSGNVIKHNRIEYSPASAAPAVFEDPSVGAFTGEVNYVFGNCPIIGNGLATEFQKDPNSGSPVYLETVWFT